VVAIDGDDDTSFAACEPFLGDERIGIVRHARRLGWVGNIGHLFAAGARSGAAYVVIQPHDDLMRPGYLAALVAQAERSPGAAAVYSEIGVLGDSRVFRVPAVTGTPFERQRAMLTTQYSAAAIRGLTRVAALALVPPIAGNDAGDFAVDTVWCARLATVGELLLVPEVLYLKRYHAGNTHMKWATWARDRKIAAWKRHCLDMLAEAFAVAANAREAEQLMQFAMGRLVRGVAGSPYNDAITRLDAPGRQALVHGFSIAALNAMRTVKRRPALPAAGG
jgi:hypothetical protein